MTSDKPKLGGNGSLQRMRRKGVEDDVSFRHGDEDREEQGVVVVEHRVLSSESKAKDVIEYVVESLESEIFRWWLAIDLGYASEDS